MSTVLLLALPTCLAQGQDGDGAKVVILQAADATHLTITQHLPCATFRDSFELPAPEGFGGHFELRSGAEVLVAEQVPRDRSAPRWATAPAPSASSFDGQSCIVALALQSEPVTAMTLEMPTGLANATFVFHSETGAVPRLHGAGTKFFVQDMFLDRTIFMTPRTPPVNLSPGTTVEVSWAAENEASFPTGVVLSVVVLGLCTALVMRRRRP